jgi:hypothetical protein
LRDEGSFDLHPPLPNTGAAPMRAFIQFPGLVFGLGIVVLAPLTGQAALGSGLARSVAIPSGSNPFGDPPPRILPADSLNDGPHVYWQNDSTALAFYHCNGAFAGLRFIGREAVVVPGFCDDEGVEYLLSPGPPEVEPDSFDGVSSIFTVSDVHGEYDALVKLLVNAGIIGEDLSWSWGEGHLVVLGDIFDRGGKVTECLWLVHRLERQARAAGGRVHYTLGNHEVMVMQRDLRYVHQRYLDGVAETSGIPYEDLFGPGMELGRWLRTKHAAVRLNGILFVHAGIGPEVLKRDLDLSTINGQARAAIDLRSYDLIFNDMPGFLLDRDGPLWYRGYHGATSSYPQATDVEIRAVLEHFSAHTVVVGHTDIGEIQSLHGGLVFGVDMSLEQLGSFQGLLWEEGEFFKVQGDGSRESMGKGGATGESLSR